ncbi:MAG: hypothetical protein M3280_01580 [Actinomycetota bacterium]|nr:hypothetical protein [Actinomycetota bacterium]
MIPVVVVLVLVTAALVYVGAPLRTAREEDVGETDAAVREARSRTEIALGALLDLEEERESGRLNESDYEPLRHRYEAEAVVALRKADSLQGTPEDEIEDEIERIKQRLRCPSCGAPRAPGERCSKCGA